MIERVVNIIILLIEDSAVNEEFSIAWHKHRNLSILDLAPTSGSDHIKHVFTMNGHLGRTGLPFTSL